MELRTVGSLTVSVLGFGAGNVTGANHFKAETLLKTAVDAGQVMPNVPQMGQFFSALGAALQLATNGKLSASAALHQAWSNLRHESAVR